MKTKPTKPTANKKEYLTRKEVMELLSISSATLSNYVKAGKFKQHAITPRCVRFKRTELIRAVNKS